MIYNKIIFSVDTDGIVYGRFSLEPLKLTGPEISRVRGIRYWPALVRSVRGFNWVGVEVIELYIETALLFGAAATELKDEPNI